MPEDARAVTITTINDTPIVIVPEGYKVEELERLLPSPVRKRGNVSLNDAESFLRYVNLHKETGTLILATQSAFHAIFDHHASVTAGWKAHTAKFAPQATKEWNDWNLANKKQMSQSDFATFLEDHQSDIVTPNGAEILEIASRIEATTTVAFTSGVRIDNGNQELRYEETTEAKAGTKGALVIPTGFTIGLKLFENGIGYSIGARLRWRLKDKALTLWYELIKPHLVLRDAMSQIAFEITAVTGIKPLNGNE